jgi:hypothetical protein
MTKVQMRFKLQRPLDNILLARISDAHAFYGIQWIRVSPAMDGLTVEYDATRLRPAEVESALLGGGIPVIREAAGTAVGPPPHPAAGVL